MRAYVIRATSSGRPSEPVERHLCADDDEALILCHQMLANHHGVEAWEGDRLVCRMTQAGAAKSRFS